MTWCRRQSEANTNKHFRSLDECAVRTGWEKDSPKAEPEKLPKNKVIEAVSAMELPEIAGAKDKYLRIQFGGGATVLKLVPCM